MKNNWECMKFDEQLKWIEQAKFLKDKGFFERESVNDLAKIIYEAKTKC